ncbi:PREDICTED: uncharacterized protein LOC105567623 [Vollenhovia emeryi]|uniref:uncharacterized protein LOC105567623 n=1 Tax=Vollenhovia emeryi TaxID=411798 RepID=UPI0005F41665|nr:PREDICTED: uncharacterized protein LOC105567623 [Vollenhovia emeryi]
MSSTILILSGLLLSLISGSTRAAEDEQRTYGLPWQQTLRYWWKIYNAYSEEVSLGYCWASYLLKISTESPTNLSIGSTSAEDPFPRDVAADAVAPILGVGRRLREKRTLAGSVVTEPMNHPGERRVAARSRTIQRRRRWTASETRRASGAVSNYTKWNRKIDENERTAPIDYYPGRRRRALLSIVPELSREAPRDGHELSSRGSSSRVVNPTPNPRDEDKVDFGSAAPGAEDSRRKVLRSLTSHRDSSVEDAFASRSFSLQVTRGGSAGNRRFPFRRYSSSEKGDSRVDETLSDPWTPQEDPAGRRVPLNNGGSSSAPSQRPRTSVVKLMDFGGNSSCDPTINSRTPRRKPEELSRDSLLSPRGGSAIAERSFPQSPGSGEGAVKRDALLQLKTVSGSDTGKRHPRRRGAAESSTDATIHPLFSSEFRRTRQQVLPENRGDPTTPQKSREEDDDPVRTARSLSNVGQFVEADENSASTRSTLSALQDSRNPVQFAAQYFESMRSFIVSIFRTLGMFVQVGRQVMDAVQTNAGLTCTTDYLRTKFVTWLATESDEKLEKR